MDVDEQIQSVASDSNEDGASVVDAVQVDNGASANAQNQNQDELDVQASCSAVNVTMVSNNMENDPNQNESGGATQTSAIDSSVPLACDSLSNDTLMLNEEHNTSDSASGTSETIVSNDLSNTERNNSVSDGPRLDLSVQDAAEQHDEQQIENAGIDPNFPLVLVQRVSVPNNDGPPNMDQDNAQILADIDPLGEVNALNRFDIFNEDELDMGNRAEAAGAASGENSDDSDDNMMSMSEEDEYEVAISENPDLRGFHNQFVVIRNMLEQTRRSMAGAEANFAHSDTPRNALLQRFRQILFILNNRRRRLLHFVMNSANERNAVGIANAEIEAEINENALEIEPSQEEASMSIEQEEEMNENAVRFDTNLPAEHSYLGSNMSRVSGVNYFDDHQRIKLRLFLHQHVLFPGEILPFMVRSSTPITDGDHDSQNGILFGLCFPSLTNGNRDHLLYGVTCQIYELGTDERGNTLIKSRALQRFVTKASDLNLPLEYINSHPRMRCCGYVTILHDIYLPEPLKTMNMGSMNRFRDNKSMTKSYRRFQAATTPWPAHVYENHNISTIIEKARTQLAQHKIDTMPTDPTQMSYWLLRNLHLPENMIQSVYRANTVNARLKLIASTFKDEAMFGCRNCGNDIANCRELFAMSKHGVQSQYCNSAGYVHQTNTVYQVNRQNITYSGSPSTEFSWFPGYQWHIIVCKVCEHHLGWEFKAVEPNLIPKQFFGISSTSVRIRAVNERSDGQALAQHAFYNLLRRMNGGVYID